MDVFVARQPILTKSKKLFGYELLFRSGQTNSFPDLDGDVATSNLLSSSFFSVGIDKISGGNTSFINFTEPLLLKGTPSLFPQEKLMVEILENIKPTEEIIKACRELKRKGYKIALDDFEFAKDYERLLWITDIVKIDFMQTPQDDIQAMMRDLKKYPCKFLAEKIETYEEFDMAMQMGFSYFQGYFFSRPEVLKNRDIPQNKLTTLQLISEINKVEFDVDALEQLISRDVAVSYKLLKYLNSAYFSRLSPLKSIRQAIAFLGERGIRLFVSLIATSQLADDKPNELVRLAIIRARFLELLGQETQSDSGEFFMLGLFSLIDAMLDNPIDYLVEQLPISDNIGRALVAREGPLAESLILVEALEKAKWQVFTEITERLDLSADKVNEMYLDAVGWADSY